MKSNYSLRIEYDENEVFVQEFYTTRRKIEKVFYDLAFLIPDSDIHRVAIYLRHDSTEISFNNRYELINEAFRHGEVPHV